MKKILVALLLACSTSFAQVNVEISDEIKTVNSKEYYVHTVVKGQTVYSISRAYGISIKALVLENDEIANNFALAVGQEVLVPKTGELLQTNEQDIPQPQAKDYSKYFYHIVKKGEWSFKIARDYNISYKELKDHNPDVDLSNLELGMEVKIPKNNATKRKVFVSDDGMIIKTIVAGDTYASIAKAYNISEQVLRNYNTAPELMPGTVIRIPDSERKQIKIPEYKNYKFYTVKSKETLYRISRRFAVDLNLLMQINDIKDDFVIKEGQVLKIPIVQTEQTQDQSQAQPVVEKKNLEQPKMELSEDPFGNEDETIFVKHTVAKGETAYSISKLHGIPIKLLYDYNPEAKGTISINQILRIPVAGEDLDVKIDQLVLNELEKKDSLSSTKIALFLPLFLKDNQAKAQLNFSKPVRDQFFRKSLKFYKFYQGFVLALEDIVKQGKQVDLTVFDTENSEQTIKQILSENPISDFDLVVGPVYNHNIALVIDSVQKYDIPIVSPLTPKVDTTSQKYSKMFLASTPIENQIKTMVSLLSKHENTKVILVPSDKQSEKDIAKDYQKYIMKYGSVNLSFNKISNINNLGEELGLSLSKDKKNVVIIASKNESVVTQAINDIIYYTKDYDITLIGTQSWEKFQKNIELDYLFDLNLTMFSFNNIDYDNSHVKEFVNRFKEKFNTQPDQFSFRAFDIGKYFVSNVEELKKSDRDFKISKLNSDPNSLGLQSNFYLVKNRGEKCITNNATKFLRYDKSNFKIVGVEEIIFEQ